ncbi:MAG TPA: FtsX-like permease family protein [Chloroflexota bacterium]|jgi:putative ABC transport system permease protein
MLLKKAWGDLRARKLRSGLVVFSVAVAVFGVTAIILLGEQFARTATERYAASNPPDLTVDTLPMAAGPRDALAAVDNVQRVEGRVMGSTRWTPPGADRDETLALQGIADFQSPDTLDRLRIVQGAAPGRGEIVFEKASRRKYNLALGQQVTLGSGDDQHTYTIVGFGENPNVAAAPVVGFASAWLTRDDARTQLKVDGDNRVLITMREDRTAAWRDYTAQRVREALEGDEVTVLASQVHDPASTPGRDVLAAVRMVLLAFGLFGAFASGLLVINTVATIVLEQRPQIGAMKAIGGTTRDVMLVYLALALLYGALGTALGLAAGIGLAVWAQGAQAAALDEPPGSFSLSPNALGLALAIGIGTCLVAALIPSWLGARVTVREALISYGLSANFGRGLWDRLVLRVHRLPPAALLASRNAFRQPYRALLTLLGLAVATAILLAVIATLAALSQSLRAAGDAIQADLMFGFDSPAERGAVDTALTDVAGIDQRELWIVSAAKLGDTTVNVTGMPPDTAIFATGSVRPGGHWLAADATDQAVVTERLAARQHVAVGSTITLQNGSHPKQQWTVVGVVPGAGADAFAPEGAIYAPYEAVRTLVDYPENRGNQLFVRLTDRAQANVDAQARALSDKLADADLANAPVKLYEQVENTQRIFVGFVLLFSLMLVIVAAVGGLGLFGTLTMNVVERRREIGVLRSVGAPTRTLLATFLLEGVLLGLCGWALGVALGTPASRMLVNYLGDTLIPLEYAFPAGGVRTTLLATIVVALAASLGPALLATRVRIAEILRYA